MLSPDRMADLRVTALCDASEFVREAFQLVKLSSEEYQEAVRRAYRLKLSYLVALEGKQ